MSARKRTSWRTLARLAVVSAAIGAVIAAFGAAPSAEQAEMAEGYISGVVESAHGAEAGVWVIAETEELETKFAKIVVTDSEGRFVLPADAGSGPTTCGCAATAWWTPRRCGSRRRGRTSA